MVAWARDLKKDFVFPEIGMLRKKLNESYSVIA